MKRSIRIVASAVMTFAAAFGLPASASADLIDVHFADYVDTAIASGAAVIGSSGDKWNNLTGTPGQSTPVTLVNSGNASTNVKLTWTAAGDYTIPNPGSANTANHNLMTSYIITNGATQSTGNVVTISGLTPGGTYSLYLYTESNQHEGTEYNVNGVTGTTNYNNQTGFVLNDDYAHLSSVTATSLGVITINFWENTGISSSQAVLNGFQLTSATPEPTSMTLLALGFAGVAGYTWRRRKVAA
jgi:hypothetical protein